MKIYKTNKIMKKIEKWFKNVGVAVFGGFRALEWALKFFFSNQ